MANRLKANIPGKRIKVVGAGDRIFKVNEGSDAGFGAFNFTAGQAIFGRWEDSPANPVRIDGCDVLEIVEDKPLTFHSP